MKSSPKILIVEDEAISRELISATVGAKYQPLIATTGNEALKLARAENPALILMDIQMPDINGISICEILRNDRETFHIPIIMLTGHNDLQQRIQAFDNGADDFLTKPFHPVELMARISAKLRKLDLSFPNTVLNCGNLKLDPQSLKAYISGEALDLGLVEYKILEFLMQNKGTVLSRKSILKAVWKDTHVSERTIDAHIVRLRKKIENFNHKIQSVYGAGYILENSAV